VKPPPSHDIARLLVLLEQADVEVNELLPLRAEALIEHVQNLLG
jgi:hypothetical protein